MGQMRSEECKYVTRSTFIAAQSLLSSGDTLGVARIGVSLEPELLRELDVIVKERGYANRSQALRDLIRTVLIRKRWESKRSPVLATVTVMYDHRSGGITKRLLEKQHGFYHRIKSSTHVHLSQESCLEVLVAQGKATQLNRLVNELRGIKGVLHAEAVMVSPELP